MLAALQAGNLSLLLVLLLGCLWRLREHRRAAAVVAAVAMSAKLFLWPIVVWLVLTKRYVCGAYAIAALVVLNAIAWGVADGGSLVHYIRLLRRLAYLEGPYAYTVTAFAQGFGVPLRVSELITWSCVGLLLYAAWRLRFDDGRALAILVVVALVASPIVWLHYFALLAVPVALTQKSLSWQWFVPLALLWCPGQGNGTQPQTGPCPARPGRRRRCHGLRPGRGGRDVGGTRRPLPGARLGTARRVIGCLVILGERLPPESILAAQSNAPA